MATQNVTVNVGSFSNALAVTIQQATSGSRSISVFATPISYNDSKHCSVSVCVLV